MATWSSIINYYFIISFSVYSIGCGIGYGYLHRIPLRDEAHRPKEAPVITPAPDGFSEVQCYVFDALPTIRTLNFAFPVNGDRQGLTLLTT